VNAPVISQRNVPPTCFLHEADGNGDVLELLSAEPESKLTRLETVMNAFAISGL